MRTIIKATNDNLKKIIAREIKKYGYNADLNHIDVSQVEHMEGLFRESNFNGDISKWDTSRVTDMSFLFSESQFIGDISGWNTNKVKDLEF